MVSSELLEQARHMAGLSQRALARDAGVPPSTVQRIEAGQVSPTIAMLDRLLDAAGVEALHVLVPTLEAVAGRRDLNESERRSLALGALTAQHLFADPVRAITLARRNLATMSRAAGPASRPYLRRWRQLLEGPTAGVLAALCGTDDEAGALRQATPFAGLVPDVERRAALRTLRAA